VSGGLLAAVFGLAVADSFNPATIVAVALILLAGPTRPAASALTFVLGAMSTVFVLGAVIFTGAGAAAGAVGDGLVVLRRLVFLFAGISLLTAGVRRLKNRNRKGVSLPSWFGVGTALPLGVVMTGADLPNAFPYFIAIERMVAEGIQTGTALLVLAGYSFVYCIPCLVLLGLGMAHGAKVRLRLEKIYNRFSAGTIKRSVPAALALFLLAPAFLAIASWP